MVVSGIGQWFDRIRVMLLFVITLVACERNEPRRAELEPLPNQVIEDFRLQETADGRLLYDLSAWRAYVFESAQRIDVVQPKVRFYDEQHVLSSVLTAESGCVDTKSSNLVARRNVRVATRDSVFLWTDSLCWRNQLRLIATDAPVSIRRAEGTVSGIGLSADAELKRIEIRKTVQTTTGTTVVPEQSTGESGRTDQW